MPLRAHPVKTEGRGSGRRAPAIEPCPDAHLDHEYSLHPLPSWATGGTQASQPPLGQA